MLAVMPGGCGKKPARDSDGLRPEPTAASPERPTVLRNLTHREREVLGYVVAGWSNIEIANELFISDKTVSVHVSNILRKTGTSTRREAAVSPHESTSAERPPRIWPSGAAALSYEFVPKAGYRRRSRRGVSSGALSMTMLARCCGLHASK